MDEHGPMESTWAGGMIFRYVQKEETIGWTLKNEEHLGRNDDFRVFTNKQERTSKIEHQKNRQLMNDELISIEEKHPDDVDHKQWSRRWAQPVKSIMELLGDQHKTRKSGQSHAQHSIMIITDSKTDRTQLE